MGVKGLHIEAAYRESEHPLSNSQLYDLVANNAGIGSDELNFKSEVGTAKSKRSKVKREIRWHQQTLKAMGVIERVEGERGVWALADKNKKGLHHAGEDTRLIAYSTRLGAAIWANNQSLFNEIDEPIHLCITSPPYPLRVARNYGNVDEHGWVDFITKTLEPIVKNLAPGGSVVLNISNDIFEAKQPSRSLYVERMVLALHDRLGLSLMDRIPWINTSKPPSPTYWACVNRVQLCSGWEPIFWFTNDPQSVRSDNRRVLEAHSEKHKQFMANGGENRTASYGDGAYKLTPSSFSNQTKGKIPKNIIQRGHKCSDTQRLRAIAKESGLPPHPAMYPTSIPEFFIKFLTNEGDLIVDPFGGSNKTGLAAERSNRRWLSCELVLEYIQSQLMLFNAFDGFKPNPLIQH